MRPKVKESDILKTIMDGLAAKRIWRMRINTGAFAGEHKGRKRFVRFGEPGMADILALVIADQLEVCARHPLTGELTFGGHPTTALWIECKTAGGKLSPEQIAFKKDVLSRFHNYLIARSWEDVFEWLERHGV